MSKASDIERIATELESQLKRNTPEEIITGLAELVMKQSSLHPELYRAFMRQMAGHLYLKTLKPGEK